MITHDQNIASRLHRRIELVDGRIVVDKQNGAAA
jgi:predicted ABC-type transport system involved in lysophospholipase L1 biosynthesis ATPase subunit